MAKRITVGESFLEYRDTPWDERVFGIKTKEILNIHYENLENIEELLTKLESKFDNNGLIYFRVPSNDNILKKYLIENEYYIAESSLKLTNKKVGTFDFNSIFKKNITLVENLSQDHIEQIKEIAYDSFNFSRFHEDPFIDINKAKERYKKWINDLVTQKKEILIHEKNGQVYSFMFYERTSSSNISLILGGSKQGFGQITPLFWTSVLNKLKSEKIKSIDVVVSSSNLTILNLYFMNGFSVIDSMFDYHKLIERKKQ